MRIEFILLNFKGGQYFTIDTKECFFPTFFTLEGLKLTAPRKEKRERFQICSAGYEKKEKQIAIGLFNFYRVRKAKTLFKLKR